MAEETFTIKAWDATKAAFDSVDRGLGKLGVSFDKLGISAGALSATMGLSLAAAGAAIIKNQIDIADSSAKAARAVGLNVEAYSALSYQASIAMEDTGALDASLIKLTKNLGEAAQGTGTAKDAIKDLGLNARELATMSPEQALEKIADGLMNVKNSNDKARIAQDLFGRSGSQMILLLEGGSEAMRKSRAEAEKYGKVIKTDTAIAAEQFNDNITRLKANLGGMAMKITGEVLPALVRLTDAMTGQENLDTLQRERARLAVQYGTVAVQNNVVLSRKILAQIDEIDNRIIELNKRAQAANKVSVGIAQPLPAEEKKKKKEKDPAEKEREEAARKFAALDESLLSETAREDAEYLKRQQTLNDYYLQTEMSGEEFRARAVALEEQHNDKLRDIDAKGQSEQQKLWESGMNGKLEVTSQILGSLSSLMQSENKKQFEFGKAAAISSALIDTYLGAQRAFTALASIAVVGPALGTAAAAAAIIAGMARVNAIRSQKFGGTGAAAPGGGATPTYNANPNTGQPTQPIGLPGTENTQSQKTMQVYISGNVMSQQFVSDDLVPILRDLINDNDVVIFDGNSRQAQNIQAA